MANLNQIQTHAGHTVLLKLGGELIGRAQSANARRTFGTQGVYEIGTIMPVEHIPLRYDGSVTMDKFFIRKGGSGGSVSLRTTLKRLTAGLSPGAPATDEDIILRAGLLNITVHEQITVLPTVEGNSPNAAINSLIGTNGRVATQAGRVIRAYLGCTLSDYSEVFRTNAIAGENATWFFLDCLDAADVQNEIQLTLTEGSV